MAGNWSGNHREFLEREACDVWLLTEVHPSAAIRGMRAFSTVEPMGPDKTFAAVFGRLAPEGGIHPHRATACAYIGGVRYLSSVLPWRTCGPTWPGSSQAEKQALALEDLRPFIDDATVWGGDWNQALEGPDWAGTNAGRSAITELLAEHQLSVPTKSLASASRGQRSVDHIALPVTWDVSSVLRVSANVEGYELSDHDAYVVAVAE